MEIAAALTSLHGSAQTPVFVLLHGWGADERDLPDLLNYCARGADYASLRAPIAYGMGYTWFDEWAHEGVPEGASLDRQALRAAEAVDRWVAEHIPADRQVVMMGFSQGGLLAAHMLRVNPSRYMAAVAFSGWLAPGALPGDRTLAESKPPVFYGHGALDPIFSADEVTAMSDFWRGHGTLDEYVYPGVAHGICMEEMRDAARFLERIGTVRPVIW
ncbi:alpha/beta hydrolase [Bifidobacterium eulemuris]|uniref:Dienelactone hydrolase family protein n=1 Tax=Bifidobacterium eulemuris TaxID=1765219 RepID=A0A261G7A4_9BIFI|nr:dienelactone hydrolase family protein [Bifidobacterium eulemuris]OZG67298.1 phospholipase [Bifidobacterium eulemuris]QOL32881.1 dienelactone hydrolase family protein [Bifidobacterium eulemuris]